MCAISLHRIRKLYLYTLYIYIIYDVRRTLYIVHCTAYTKGGKYGARSRKPDIADEADEHHVKSHVVSYHVIDKSFSRGYSRFLEFQELHQGTTLLNNAVRRIGVLLT